MDEEQEREQAEVHHRMNVLVANTAQSLRDAGESREAIAGIIYRFQEEGLQILYHPAMMWGYFEMALELAGYNAAAQDRRLRIYSTVSHDRFAPGKPFPKDWPWLEDEGNAEPGAPADRPRD